MLLISPNYCIAFCRVLSYPSYLPWACLWLWARRSNPKPLMLNSAAKKLHIWPTSVLFHSNVCAKAWFLINCFIFRPSTNGFMWLRQTTSTTVMPPPCDAPPRRLLVHECFYPTTKHFNIISIKTLKTWWVRCGRCGCSVFPRLFLLCWLMDTCFWIMR